MDAMDNWLIMAFASPILWAFLTRTDLAPPSGSSDAHGPGTVATLFGAVTCFSLYMVLEAKAFASLEYAEVVINFHGTVFLLTLGILAAKAAYRHRITGLLRRFAIIFLTAEAFELAARLSAQRAMELGPSITAVALVQCLLPPLIVLFSLMMIASDRRGHFLKPDSRLTFSLQTEDLLSKAALLVATIAAVLVMQLEAEPPW